MLRSVLLDPEPADLPDDAAAFVFLARLLVGPSEGPGEELFDVTVSSPEWLVTQCREHGEIISGLHHVFVDASLFDRRRLTAWFEARVAGIEADSWHEIGEKMSRLGHWEFQDYAE